MAGTDVTAGSNQLQYFTSLDVSSSTSLREGSFVISSKSYLTNQ